MHDYTQRLKKIEAVLQKKLPRTFCADWQEYSFGSLSSAVTNAHLEALVKPCRDLLLLGGKRWRPLLLVLCAELAGENPQSERAYELTPAVEFVHTASLIHDDIEDGADLRRGKPTAHLTFGIDTAVNAASWLYFEAFACIREAPISAELTARLYAVMSEQLRRLHLGQSMDISWHKGTDFPSRAEYETMIRLKTGTLANLAAQLGMLCSGAPEARAHEVGLLAADIGAGFQILDDVINITSGNPGKKRGDDIVEGKKSLPILLHIAQNPTDSAKISAYFSAARTNGIDTPEVEACINLLQNSGSAAAAKDYAASLIHGACKSLENLYQNNPAVPLITGLFTGML